jgi:hypothetical protein
MRLAGFIIALEFQCVEDYIQPAFISVEVCTDIFDLRNVVESKQDSLCGTLDRRAFLLPLPYPKMFLYLLYICSYCLAMKT